MNISPHSVEWRLWLCRNGRLTYFLNLKGAIRFSIAGPGEPAQQLESAEDLRFSFSGRVEGMKKTQETPRFLAGRFPPRSEPLWPIGH